MTCNGAELPNWLRDRDVLGFLWFKTYTLRPARAYRESADQVG